MDIRNYIQDSIDTKTKILANDSFIASIKDIADEIIKCYARKNKVLTAGNGGSAGDAQHITGELVSKFIYNRPGLNAISLATNTSILSAISNDFGFEYVFAKQIQANGEKGDIFIAISTSGNSKNIILALEEAKNHGLITVGFTGKTASQMDELCDYILHVPSTDTPIIQESHIMIGHIICALVEESLFAEYYNKS